MRIPDRFLPWMICCALFLSCSGGGRTGSSAAPLPTISAFDASPATVTTGGTSSLTAVFDGGTGLITPGNLTAVSGNAVPVVVAATTTYTLTVTASAGQATRTVLVTAVPAPATPVISAPASVNAGTAGYTASVPVQAGCSYAWTITGGAISAGSGTSQVTFTAGASGSVQLGCVVTNAAGAASDPGSATCLILVPLPFTVASGALTLPVPPAANGASPYSGTFTVTVTRDPGFTGAVTLALDPAQIPAGVKASLLSTTLAPGTASTTLSVQAGFATNAAFSTFTWPALGSFPITITASAAGAPSATGTLTLQLIPEPSDFGLAFVLIDFRGTHLLNLTDISVLPGVPVTAIFEAYWAAGPSISGPVTLGLQGAPALLNASIDTTAGNLNEVHTLTIQPLPGLPAGTYSFLLSATYQGVTRTLPVVATFSPAPFYIQPPPGLQVSVAQGQTLSFPLYLWHDDTFFDATGYIGATSLSVDPPPAGLQAAFADTNPVGMASVRLDITAAPTLAPGSYPLSLQATRLGLATVPAAPLVLTVNVTRPADPPTLWIQNVEWGQGVLAPGLRLVGGKPSLLRVQLLADRPGVAAPSVSAAIRDSLGNLLDTLPLLGPATVPSALAEGDLPTAMAVSSTTYTALVPAGDIQPGMQVTVQAGAAAPWAFSPAVDPGSMLDLVVVPVYCQGVAPVIPADHVLTGELTAFWPLRGVNLVHRAPYSTSTVMPQPSSPDNAAAWNQLLNEVATLRVVDGQAADYYGFFNPGLLPGFGSSIAGLSFLGVGAGIGIDQTTAALFQNDDAPRDLATVVMVHETGHAFNLNHAPAGGAPAPQLDFPYAGAAIGTWGFDPAAQAGHDPAQESDIMGYGPGRHWVSDWNYRSAMGFLGERQTPPVGLAAASQQWVVSGWIEPGGRAHLLPLVGASCVPAPPRAGDLSLRLDTSAGPRTIPFSAAPVPDLPEGHRSFTFTVPAGGEVNGMEVSGAGIRPERRSAALSLASRALALSAAALDGSLAVQETPGWLHLAWDVQAHPYLNLFHEGAHRTTLGLHLAGGRADVPLDGLPAGGRFVLHFSDGLNAAVLSVTR